VVATLFLYSNGVNVCLTVATHINISQKFSCGTHVKYIIMCLNKLSNPWGNLRVHCDPWWAL